MYTRASDIPAPGNPMMVLLLPTRTFTSPLIVPLTTTIKGAVLFFSPTAAVNSASVDTVVVAFPAEPPVVLYKSAKSVDLIFSFSFVCVCVLVDLGIGANENQSR